MDSLGRLLLVDDESSITSSLKRLLRQEPYDVVICNDPFEVIDTIKTNNNISVIMSDHNMPGISGAEVLSMVKENFPHIVRLMLTGHADLDIAMQAINHGYIYKLVHKPWDEDGLKHTLREAFSYQNIVYQRRATPQAYESQFESIVITDLNNKILSHNKTFSRAMAATTEDLISKPLGLVSETLNSETDMKRLHSVIASGGEWSGAIKLEKFNHEIVSVWMIVNVERDAAHPFISYSFVNLGETVM